jgi:hypothetical protein
MDSPRLNCAGQGCSERTECRRYRIRLPVERSKKEDEKVFDWASFDIEKIVFGDCKAVIKFRES